MKDRPLDDKKLRNEMVDNQLIARGIRDELVLAAMRKVPRHKFVPAGEERNAYRDCPIGIGHGQTISQPYMVALMSECLRPSPDKDIFEVGTGSGYQTAVLAEICRHVDTVERIEGLSRRARDICRELGYENISFFTGDGSLGFSDGGKTFDGIMVTASSPEPMEHILDSLKEGGRCVMPIGNRGMQELILFHKDNGEIRQETVCRCVFVPLIGKYGFQ